MSSTGVVVFDPAAWKAMYPEFDGITDAAAQGYFDQACLYLDNTPCSAVRDVSRRRTLLYMLTAHIAALFGGANGQAPSPLVGRVSNATEGSVSVGVDFPTTPNAAWFAQTKYGAAYWQATARYRTMHYVPGPVTPIPFGYPYAFPGMMYGRRQ